LSRSIQRSFSILSYLFVLVLLSGCFSFSNSSDSEKMIEQSNEPVSLVVAAYLPRQLFSTFISEPVKKKYPNIDLVYQPLNSPDVFRETEPSVMPDLILDVDRLFIPSTKPDKWNYDLSIELGARNFDLSRFQPDLIDRIASFGEQGQFLSLPLFRFNFALNYNKEIFDLFEVPYPKDGLTWDEVIDLSRKFAEPKDGVRYTGFDPILDGTIAVTYLDQRSLTALNPQSNEPIVTSPEWKTAVRSWKSIFDSDREIWNMDHGTNYSFLLGRAAMTISSNLSMSMLPEGYSKIRNYDLATYPRMSSDSNFGAASRVFMLSFLPNNHNMKASFEVAEYLVSDEMQSFLSRSGFISVLQNEDIQQEYASGVEYASGKNIAALSKLPEVPYTRASKYEAAFLEKMLIMMNGIGMNPETNLDETLLGFEQTIKDQLPALMNTLQAEE